MIGLLESKRKEIAVLCRRHRVRRLDVFGSAATDAFDPRTSWQSYL
jgi:predicted nucleotidyltransferase